MLGFLRRRRRGGRHVLGAAVTGIPAAPRPAIPAVVAVPAPEPTAAAVTRVELVFRDGTSAELDPASAQACAIGELAATLVLRLA